MNKPEYISHNKSAKIASLRFDNQRAILSYLQHFGILSVSDLSEMVGLSKTTVAKILYSLVDLHLVNSVGKGSSTREGGKKPELFSLNAGFRYSIALTMHADYFDLAVLDLNSEIRYRINDPERTYSSYQTAVDLIAELVEEAIVRFGLMPRRIYSVTVSVDGIIDAVRGVIRYTERPGWGRDLPFEHDIRARLNFSPPAVFLDNPAAYMGFSELLYTENAQLEKLIFLHTDSSAGGCILVQQKILHGSNGFIGEFGHIIVEPDSPIRCSCGGTGCFESLVSPETLLAQARKTSGVADLTENRLFQDYLAGVPYAADAIGRIVRYFSILIHNLILVDDPDKVIIQGTYVKAGDAFLKSLNEQIHSFPFYNVRREIKIEFARNDVHDACLIGAGHHSFIHLLDSLDNLGANPNQ